MIGPFSFQNHSSSLDELNLSKYFNHEIIQMIKSELMIIPVVDERLIFQDISMIISTILPKEDYKINHITEDEPHSFIPDKNLFKAKNLNLQKRMDFFCI